MILSQSWTHADKKERLWRLNLTGMVLQVPVFEKCL